MKPVHLLRTALEAADCRALFEAAASGGVRVGWLDLASSATPSAELGEAAARGAFRSVAVTPGLVLTAKPLKGPAVLQDLVREHFAGCRLVVVRGDVQVPELLQTPSGYRVRGRDGRERSFSPEELAAVLSRSRPFESS